LNIPLLAGSTLPLCWRRPFLEHELHSPIEEALSIGYGGVESYGFHALETLQCMVERRQGGETGVAAVQCLEGEAVWEAGRESRWSRELAEAACAAIEETPDSEMDASGVSPAAFLIEYRDGLRAAVLMLNGYVHDFAYAARVGDEVQATEFYLQRDFPHGHFNFLCLNFEDMVLSGTPPYPAERTLLTTGIMDAVMISRHNGHTRVETPHLGISYRSYEQPPHRATVPRPSGANLAIWPPR
jgi:hypothetical protein